MRALSHGGGFLLSFAGRRPAVADDAFVAPGTSLIGDVSMAEGSSVWFNCVLRGDVASITIGARTNIQDGTVVHVDPGLPVTIGADAVVGHLAIIHGCTIEDDSFVGMGAIVMSGATIARGGMLAAGSLLPGGKTVGPDELWAGRPAKFVRMLTGNDIEAMRFGSSHYHRNAARFREAAQNWSLD